MKKVQLKGLAVLVTFQLALGLGGGVIFTQTLLIYRQLMSKPSWLNKQMKQ